MLTQHHSQAPCSPPVLPARKHNRLQGYDYSQQGAYFITVCTQNRAELFGHITAVGANCVRPNCVHPNCVRPSTELSDLGEIVRQAIETLSNTYPMVSVEAHVIMPNHVHMIIVIGSADVDRTQTNGQKQTIGRTQFAPTVSRMIKQWKGAITKRLGFSPWQKSFHDHVIRSQDDYLRIAEYMENNPAQWELDSLHPANTGNEP